MQFRNVEAKGGASSAKQEDPEDNLTLTATTLLLGSQKPEQFGETECTLERRHFQIASVFPSL